MHVISLLIWLLVSKTIFLSVLCLSTSSPSRLHWISGISAVFLHVLLISSHHIHVLTRRLTWILHRMSQSATTGGTKSWKEGQYGSLKSWNQRRSKRQGVRSQILKTGVLNAHYSTASLESPFLEGIMSYEFRMDNSLTPINRQRTGPCSSWPVHQKNKDREV